MSANVTFVENEAFGRNEIIMKRELFNNKLMKRIFYFGLLGLMGLATAITFTDRTNAQTGLQKMLAGNSEKNGS